MSDIRLLGELAGHPVEVISSMNHPDVPPGGMSCGLPTLWIRWGGGPWWVQEGHRMRGAYQVKEWLDVGPWSLEDAIELWSRFGYPQPTEEESERAVKDFGVAWEAGNKAYGELVERYRLEHIERARVYAKGIGL